MFVFNGFTDVLKIYILPVYCSEMLFRLIVQQVAMRLLEKDIHDKQDTLISIRRQLEDVKKLNLELHNKLQVTWNKFNSSLWAEQCGWQKAKLSV